MQACMRYLLVCKSWNELATPILSRRRFAILKAPLHDGPFPNSVVTVTRRNTFGGRYRAKTIIESNTSPSAVASIIWRGSQSFQTKVFLGHLIMVQWKGCHGAIAIIIKISDRHKEYETEKEVYTWLADVKTRPSYVPQLFLGVRISNEYNQSLHRMIDSLQK